MKEAEKISLGKNWNTQDKAKIKRQLKKKLKLAARNLSMINIIIHIELSKLL